MKSTLEVRLGAFFVLAIIAAFVLMEMVGNREMLGPSVSARALFDNIKELRSGDPVKMAGVVIGKVDSINLKEGRVEVTMRIRSGLGVTTNSKASIKFMGLLGQNYVAIDYSVGPEITTDALLDSYEQSDLSSLMSRLDNVAQGVEEITKNFSGENFTQLLGPFTDFLTENKESLSSIVTNIYRISTQMASGQGTAGKIIMEDTLYASALTTVTNLNETTLEIKSTVNRVHEMVRDIADGEGALGQLVASTELYDEISEAVTHLKEILEKVNKGEGSAGMLVNDSALYQNARLTLQKVNQATESLEDQGPLSVLGLAVGSLF